MATEQGKERALVVPHGGVLVDPMASPARASELRGNLEGMPHLTLDPRQMWDTRMLLVGALSPLDGFMDRNRYDSVVKRARLVDGTVWPMPITLDVDEEFVEDHQLDEGTPIALRSPEGRVIAVLEVSDAWHPDRQWEAEQVYGTSSEAHPGVRALMAQRAMLLGGRLIGLEIPEHHTWLAYRYTPRELRARWSARGWTRVLAFQTRNPMHRIHCALAQRGADRVGAKLLIHPVVGPTKPGDIDVHTRIRCYRAVLPRFDAASTDLALLPLAMRMAGPREALWHAIVRQNYGCSHFGIGRDHAGCADQEGRPFYGRYEAQDFVAEFESELEIQIHRWEEVVYSAGQRAYLPVSEVEEDADARHLSGSELRRLLREGGDIPPWFSYPEVLAELRQRHPPRHLQGLTLFFTGLPSSGKSTIAGVVQAKLLADGTRPVTLLDGTVVREHLSSDLGFSKHDRDLNTRRLAFVAGEVTRNRGVAICASIAPYASAREQARTHIEGCGGFVLIHVSTPLDVCRRRDRRGMYRRAELGQIRNFTGVDDPYELPSSPDVRVDTSKTSPEACAVKVLDHLVQAGFLTTALVDGERGSEGRESDSGVTA